MIQVQEFTRTVVVNRFPKKLIRRSLGTTFEQWIVAGFDGCQQKDGRWLLNIRLVKTAGDVCYYPTTQVLDLLHIGWLLLWSSKTR